MRQIPDPKDRAGLRAELAQDQLQQRRFAAAVRADQADLLPGLDFPVQLAQNGMGEVGVARCRSG